MSESKKCIQLTTHLQGCNYCNGYSKKWSQITLVIRWLITTHHILLLPWIGIEEPAPTVSMQQLRLPRFHKKKVDETIRQTTKEEHSRNYRTPIT